MRKSQIQAQVFVYILSLFIMALVLVYGYKAVKDIRDKAHFTELVNFKTELDTTISSIRHDYGSIRNVEFDVPSGFRQVCFVDLSSVDPEDDIPGGTGEYPIIRNYVWSIKNTNAEPKNVFLWPPGTESQYIGNITLNQNFTCFDVSSGKMRLRLEGLGDRTKIS